MDGGCLLILADGAAGMSDELRKSRRVPTNVRVYFGTRGADHLGIVQDLSEDGIRVRARKAHPKDTTLQLKVEVPGQGMVSAKGIVKRSRKIRPSLFPNEPMEMGIVIIDGNKHLKEMVQKLLDGFNERRARRRKEAPLQAVIGNVQRLLEEYTQNIGDGGLFVVTENPAGSGEVISVRIFLPTPFGEIRAECKVVHVVSAEEATMNGRLPGCGFKFVSFVNGDEKKYLDYLKNLHGEN